MQTFDGRATNASFWQWKPKLAPCPDMFKTEFQNYLGWSKLFQLAEPTQYLHHTLKWLKPENIKVSFMSARTLN